MYSLLYALAQVPLSTSSTLKGDFALHPELAQATSDKRQATSDKRQATSDTERKGI